jgi:hypothetical protein
MGAYLVNKTARGTDMGRGNDLHLEFMGPVQARPVGSVAQKQMKPPKEGGNCSRSCTVSHPGDGQLEFVPEGVILQDNSIDALESLQSKIHTYIQHSSSKKRTLEAINNDRGSRYSRMRPSTSFEIL